MGRGFQPSGSFFPSLTFQARSGHGPRLPSHRPRTRGAGGRVQVGQGRRAGGRRDALRGAGGLAVRGVRAGGGAEQADHGPQGGAGRAGTRRRAEQGWRARGAERAARTRAAGQGGACVCAWVRWCVSACACACARVCVRMFARGPAARARTRFCTSQSRTRRSQRQFDKYSTIFSPSLTVDCGRVEPTRRAAAIARNTHAHGWQGRGVAGCAQKWRPRRGLGALQNIGVASRDGPLNFHSQWSGLALDSDCLQVLRSTGFTSANNVVKGCVH